MQLGASNVGLSSNLFSSDGVLRNGDVISAESNSFLGYGAVFTTAAQRGVVQLLNPNSSGQIILIDRITITSGVTNDWFLSLNQSQKASSVGAWKNRRAGSGDGVAQLIGDTVAITPALEWLFGNVLAGATVTLDFDPPLYVPESALVTVYQSTAAGLLAVNFYGREFAV